MGHKGNVMTRINRRKNSEKYKIAKAVWKTATKKKDRGRSRKTWVDGVVNVGRDEIVTGTR